MAAIVALAAEYGRPCQHQDLAPAVGPEPEAGY